MMSTSLFDVATGKTPHLYAGRCPDSVNGPESRDPDCPACQAIAAAEAALAEPKPDADGWIRWDGFHFPIQDGVAHQVRFRDGEVSEVDYEASGWPWMHDGDDSDIVAYRVAGESK